MNIASYLFCGLTILRCFCWAEEDVDPFVQSETPPPKPVVPNRGIVTLPGSVTHQQIEKNHHQYRISGLYRPNVGRDPRNSEAHYVAVFQQLMPEGSDVKAKLENKTLTIRTSQPISYDTLAYAVDGLASGGGEVPTWDELEARDLKQSEHFDPAHYRIEKFEGEFPRGLAWLSLPRTEELRVPFVTALSTTGLLLIGPTTGRCMCHSRYAVRILDENGQLIWKSTDPVFGSIRIAAGDTNGDGMHELYFETEDHGTTARHVLKPKR